MLHLFNELTACRVGKIFLKLNLNLLPCNFNPVDMVLHFEAIENTCAPSSVGQPFRYLKTATTSTLCFLFYMLSMPNSLTIPCRDNRSSKRKWLTFGSMFSMKRLSHYVTDSLFIYNWCFKTEKKNQARKKSWSNTTNALFLACMRHWE